MKKHQIVILTILGVFFLSLSLLSLRVTGVALYILMLSLIPTILIVVIAFLVFSYFRHHKDTNVNTRIDQSDMGQKKGWYEKQARYALTLSLIGLGVPILLFLLNLVFGEGLELEFVTGFYLIPVFLFIYFAVPVCLLLGLAFGVSSMVGIGKYDGNRHLPFLAIGISLVSVVILYFLLT